MRQLKIYQPLGFNCLRLPQTDGCYLLLHSFGLFQRADIIIPNLRIVGVAATIDPSQVPVMLAQLHVEEGTPFEVWLIAIKLVVVSSMNMGAFSPGLAVVLGNLKACLSSQYPTVLVFSCLALNRSYNSLEEVWAIFDTATENMTGAKRATHVSVSPPVPSFQKYSRHSKPRVMSVSANRYLPIMENVHGVEFDDESELIRVYSVAQNPRSKTPRLFKHDFDSAESREGRMRVGSACINCAGDDHSLRDCIRDYINRCGLFLDEFGAGTSSEVPDRWVYTRGKK